MQIVIEIDNTDYRLITEKMPSELSGEFIETIFKKIENGIPLPKGHGDLIDRSTLHLDTEWSEWYDDWVSYSYGQIADADVVIKADGGVEDADSD